MKDEGLELPIQRAIEIFQATLDDESEWFSSRNPLRPSSCSPLGIQTDWIEVYGELRRDRILLQTRDSGSIRFWHQTIQEYFAAYYICNEISPLFEKHHDQAKSHRATRQREHKLERYIRDSRWHEILAIVSGLIVSKPSAEFSGTTNQSVVEFIDRIWHKNRLLAAMCLSNVEHLNTGRLASYVDQLRRQIYLWGVLLPRFYPWLMLAILLAAIWLMPQEATETLLNLAQTRLGLPHIIAQFVSVLLALVLGIVIVTLFFRYYAIGIQWLETFTNEHFIRPGISALRYIRNEEAERLLAEFWSRIADDFAIGDITRSTIQTGLALPIRGESELILMLNSAKTRLQAMERLAELGSQRAIDPLRRLLDKPGLDELAFASTTRSLARIGKLLPSQSPNRLDLESHLREILGDRQKSHAKRMSAFRGLLVLGIVDVRPPERGFDDLILGVFAHRILLAILALLLLLSLLAYFLMLFGEAPWRNLWK